MTNLLFVYGTLKKYERNHMHMEKFTFLEKTTSRDADWDILEFTYQPAHPVTPILTKGKHYICGEIYQIEPQDLPMLDAFEGDYYTRDTIELAHNKMAWCYVLHPTHQPPTMQDHHKELRKNNIIEWSATPAAHGAVA